MNVNIKPLYFITKSFVYTSPYKKMIKFVSEKSESIRNNNDQDFVNQFMSNFMSSDNTLKSCQFSEYSIVDNQNNLKKCNKSNFTLFLIRDEYLQSFCDAKIFIDKINEIFACCFSLFSLIYELAKENYYSFAFTSDILSQMESFYSFVKPKKAPYSFEVIKGAYYQLKKLMKELKQLVSLTELSEENKFLNMFSSLSTSFTTLDSFFDIYDLIGSGAFKVFVCVSSLGVMSLSFLYYQHKNIVCNIEEKAYNPLKDNALIKSTSDVASKINSVLNKLPKIFSFLNLNYFFLENNNVLDIFDYPDKHFFDFVDEEKRKIDYKRVPAFKSVYLKITNCQKNVDYNDESFMIFFDYLSLLVGFEHNYDCLTLWDYCNAKPNVVGDLQKSIVDKYNRPCEHLYYCDNLFTISSCDLRLKSSQFKYLCGVDYLQAASHRYRYYSYWDFIELCGTLTYSTILNNIFYLEDKFLIDNFSKYKSENILDVYLCSYINIIASSEHYIHKNKIVSKYVFEKIGIDAKENDIHQLSNSTWKTTEVRNTKFNYVLSFFLSLSSIIISIVGFGFISRVYVDGMLCINPPPSDMANLFFGILKTEKFWLVVILALIPLIILVVYYLHLICLKRRIIKSLPKKAGYSTKCIKIKRRNKNNACFIRFLFDKIKSIRRQ